MQNYCKLFVQSSQSHECIIDLITTFVCGVRHRYRVDAKSMEIYVHNNDDYNESMALEGETNFLHFKYFLDIEPTEGESRTNYICSVGQLLEKLWLHGLKAVAACNFEEQLPRNGGFVQRVTE